MLDEQNVRPDFVAGHSLGEYSALVAAKSLAFADAVRLVRKRGRYMQEAVPVGVGAMAALLKLPAGKLDAVLSEASQGEVVTAANFNSPDQVVIAGHTGAVARAVELAKAAGARRALLLPVSAPFHCPLMEPAQRRLKADLDATEFRDLAMPLVNGWQAKLIRTGAEAREGLVSASAQPGPVDGSDPKAGFARRWPLYRSGRRWRAHWITPQHRQRPGRFQIWRSGRSGESACGNCLVTDSLTVAVQ